MRKGMLVATMIAVIVSFASMAFAEVGFQFRIPMQVTGKKTLKDVNGQSTLLTFDLDNNTTVGILNEDIDFTDNSGAAPVNNTYTLNAIRVSKAVLDPVSVGLDIGTVNCGASNKSVADLFGNVKLLTSKGKVSSFLNVELLYRFLKTDLGTGVTDFSGAMVNIGAGINF